MTSGLFFMQLTDAVGGFLGRDAGFWLSQSAGGLIK